MSKREVLDEELLENIPLELIMEEEMPELDRLLDAETELPTGEKGVATQAVATQLDANGEGGKEEGHNSRHPCQGLPITVVYVNRSNNKL